MLTHNLRANFLKNSLPPPDNKMLIETTFRILPLYRILSELVNKNKLNKYYSHFGIFTILLLQTAKITPLTLNHIIEILPN